jgi:hypothetical protein
MEEQARTEEQLPVEVARKKKELFRTCLIEELTGHFASDLIPFKCFSFAKDEVERDNVDNRYETITLDGNVFIADYLCTIRNRIAGGHKCGISFRNYDLQHKDLVDIAGASLPELLTSSVRYRMYAQHVKRIYSLM